MTVPSWVSDAIFYQIFPDRFANGDPANDPPHAQPWGEAPTLNGFQGGDLRGITDRLEYLTDLGVNAVYLNPIFQAGSNHRYNTSDYFQIDDRLGTVEDFRRLIDRAHAAGIRVILDGVFNHSGRGFPAFRELLDRGKAAATRDWYHVGGLPLDAFGGGSAGNYQAWWGIRSLPKFNTGNPETRAFLLRVARHWIEQGADGWRLDVPNEISDPAFWAEFHRTVRAANPEAYLLGEIWEVDPKWVGDRAFDGLMNYPLRKALLALAVGGNLGPKGFRAEVERMNSSYPAEHVQAHYNLLGSHDTERVATLASGDEARIRLMFSLLFTLPGVPGIYYGDEIGLEGGKDPDCRRAFPWERDSWNEGRRAWIAGLARARASRIELRRGTLEFLTADEKEGALAFVRRHQEQACLVAANVSNRRRGFSLGRLPSEWRDGRPVTDVLTGRGYRVEAGAVRLDLNPFEAVLLRG